VNLPEPVFGLVLAGGRSRRMGSDKASLVKDGQTQLSRAVDLLETALERAYVSARADQAGDPVRSGFEQIVDRYDDLGPVAGILSAMDHDPDAAWLVLACDLPNADPGTIRFLLDCASPAHPATAFRSAENGLPEPLCAIYRPAMRPVIDRFVADGIVCPRKMLINTATHLLDLPNPGALHNVNTPQDLAGTHVKVAR